MSRDTEDNETDASESMLDHSVAEKMQDKYYMTYLLFYALGTLTQVPSNFFTTATDYWMYKFRDPHSFNETWNSENRTGLQAEFIADFSIVSNVTNIAFVVVALILAKKVSLLLRLVGALCSTLIFFTITVIFVEVNTDTWQRGFFIFTLITGSLLTASGSVFMVTLFALVSKFPPHYLAAILTGQSLCGIFSALVQIFSLSIGASSRTSGLVYFLIGMFFIFVTLICLVLTLQHSKFFNYHFHKETIQTESPKITKAQVFKILNQIKYYLISMIVVLGSTIMIHPGVTSLVTSVDKGNGNQWNDVFFVPVATFLSYNVFDFIGRESAGKIKRPRNGVLITIASIIRIGFVPFIMFCNALPRKHLPVAFDVDYAYIIVIMIFGFTNGYLVNLCVINVPEATDIADRKIALGLIVILMIVSLGTCSFLSALVIKAL